MAEISQNFVAFSEYMNFTYLLGLKIFHIQYPNGKQTGKIFEKNNIRPLFSKVTLYVQDL